MELDFDNCLGSYLSQHLHGQKSWNYALDDLRVIGQGFRVRFATIHPTPVHHHERWVLAEGVKTLKEAKKIAEDHYQENKGGL